MVSIVPINSLDASFLTRLALCLEERFLFSCQVERVVRIPRTTLNSVRGQLFFNTLVSKVLGATPQAEGLRLAITDYDLYKTSHQFVFGDASEEHRIAAVSLHRLRSDFYGEASDPNLLFQRTLKESVHDLGHALGHDHQLIGVGDDQPDPQVVGNMQRDPPRDPLLPERSLNNLVVTSSWGDHLDVCFREELRRRELGANARMILPRETDEALLEERLLVETGHQPRHKADGEVGIAGFESARGLLRDVPDVDRH